MARFLLLVGIVLILASIVLLILALLDPADSPLGDVFAAVICRDKEELVRHEGARQYDGRQSVSFYCEQPGAASRDVTGSMILATVSVFVAPFLGGLLLTIVTANRLARRATARLLNQAQWQVKSTSVDSGTPIVVEGKDLSPEVAEKLAEAFSHRTGGNLQNLSPEIAEKVAQALTPLIAKTAQINGGEPIAAELAQALGQSIPATEASQSVPDEQANLADRLQQLESALSQGLITQKEYDNMRKDILRDFKE